MTRDVDVLVLGAGPAGSLCAALCAEWGFDTLLVHRPVRRRSGLSHETLVPAGVDLCARHGLGEMLLAEGFLEPARHGSVWGSGELRWREDGARGHGAKVTREVFDARLREHASARGATLVEARNVIVDGDRIAIERADGTTEPVRARLRVAAVGRHVDALLDCETREDLPATLAVTLPEITPAEHADATLIEAVRAGWLWWIPRGEGRVELTLFCDREELARSGREELLRGALRNACGPAREVDPGDAGAAREGSVASVAYRRPRDEGWLLIGDAASTIDPLSSQGLEKALASAEHGAICVRAALEGDAPRSQVLEHARGWELGLYLAHLDRTRAYYASETRFVDAPFWRTRRRAPERPELPATSRPAPTLERCATLTRRAQRLEPTSGFRLDDGRAVSTLGSVSIEDLLALYEGAPATLEELVARAPSRPELRALTPRTLTSSLAELARLGLIVASEA